MSCGTCASTLQLTATRYLRPLPLPQIIAIDVVTGAVRVVSTMSPDVCFGTPSDPGLRFTLAPDGDSFLATTTRRRMDLWMLEDFAPRGGVLDWFRYPRSR